jgi:hypothetical protein
VCAFLFVSLCCALSGSGLSTSEPENDLALSETFLREAPSRWEEYTLQAKQLQGSILMEYTGTLHGLKGRTYDELRMNDSAKLNLHSTERSVAGKVDLQYSTVVGVNPEYAFYLRRKTSDSPWLVEQLIARGNADLAASLDKSFAIFEGAALALVRVEAEPLMEFVRKPGFHVVRCRKLSGNDEGLVEVTFASPQVGGGMIQGGTMILDPRRFWCLRSYRADFGHKSEVLDAHGTIDFKVQEQAETGQGFPVPRRTLSERRLINEDGSKNELRDVLEYNLSMATRLPSNAEFTLAAFGLPEPPGSAWGRPHMPLYVWVALAGAGSLILAAALRILRNRRGGATAPAK